MRTVLIIFQLAYLALFSFIYPLQAAPVSCSVAQVMPHSASFQKIANPTNVSSFASRSLFAVLTGNSVVTGKVTGTDGIVPLRGIVVTIYKMTLLGYFWECGQTITQEDGSYQFQGLAADTYKIGFDDRYSNICTSEFYNDTPNLGSASGIVVTENVTVSGIDASLLDGSEISGTVTGPDGLTPLNEVEVIAYKLHDNGYWFRDKDATTQANGSYSIRRLIPGTYRIAFSGPNGAIYAEEFYNNVLKFESALNIIVARDIAITGIDASLTKSGGIKGIVTGPNGMEPLRRIEVTAYRRNAVGGWEPAKYAYTDSDGKYDLEYLVAGNYRVGFSDQDGGIYGDEFYNNVLRIESAIDIEVGEEIIVSGIDASMIEVGSIAGNVTGPDGIAPILGILVTAYRPDGAGGWQPFRETHSRLDGSYKIRGLIAGSYRVCFSDFGNRPYWSDVYPWDGKFYASEYYNNVTNINSAMTISVGDNAALSGINASLVESGKITGMVTGPDGVTPVNNISVIAYRLDDYENRTQTYTKIDGSYSLGGLVPGTYRVQFIDSIIGIYADEYYNDVVSEDSAMSILVSQNANVSGINASLLEAGRINGTVFGPDRFTPLKDIEVVVYRFESPGGWEKVREVDTRADGGYTIRGLKTGNYRIKFSDSKNGVYREKYYDSFTTIEAAKDVAVVANAVVSGINVIMSDLVLPPIVPPVPPVPPVLPAIALPQIEVVENGILLSQSSPVIFQIPKTKKSAVTKYFTVRNVGGSALTGLKITKKGARASAFSIGKLQISSLAPNGSLTVKVTFKPSTAGISNASMIIASNDVRKNPFIIRLIGKGKVKKAMHSLVASEFTRPITPIGSFPPDKNSMTTTELIDGVKYNTLTILKSARSQTTSDSVEVSANLIDWYSGSSHTTVVTDNERYFKIRDNIPTPKDLERFIRLKK